MKLYHVTEKWDGKDLQTAYDRLGDDAIEYFMEKWDCDDSAFAADQITSIYFYATVEQAQNHQDNYGGEILEIDAEYIETEIDSIEGHICTQYPVRSQDIKRLA